MKITIHIKARYGNYDLIVKEDDQAKAINTLTGKKTVNERDLRALEALGIEISYTEYAEDYLAGRL